MENDDEKASPSQSQPSDRQRYQVPSAIADFHGSLVRNSFPEPVPSKARSLSTVDHWIAYFTEGWADVGIWKSAFVEMVATCLLAYTSGLIDTTIAGFNTPQAPAYVGVTNIFLLTLFIMATGPGSGGHINPLITFATVMTGMTGFSRGLLYIIGQTIGAALAGGLLRGALGTQRTVEVNGGGCLLTPGVVTLGQAVLIETISSTVLLFLAFGVALDPRQQQLFGPFAGPFAVGCSLGLVSFASAGLVMGYNGAAMNPARCFAFAVGKRDFTNQWIWWVGPVCGTLIHTAIFCVAPPYHSSPPPI